MRKSLWLLMVFGLLITACSKDDDKTDDTKVYLPKTLVLGIDRNDLFYDSENRLVKLIMQEEGTEAYVYEYVYSDDGSIKETVTISDGIMITNYILQKNKSEVLVTRSYKGTTSTIDLIKLDSQQRMIGSGSYGEVYTYDPQGNISKVTYGGRTYTFTYDTQKGMFSKVASPSWFLNYLELSTGERVYSTVNNLARIDYVDGQDSSKETYTYKYNDSGFPTEFLYTYLKEGEESETSTTTITYY